MKTTTLLATLAFSFSISLNAQSKKNTPLIMFENDTVTLGEFEQVYKKNNSSEMVNKSTVDEYLDLYITFKRKVMEAEEMGMDTSGSFLKEYNMYRDQLAQPYFTIDEVKEKLHKEAYERMKTEVKASHIMVKMPADALPEDTLKAYMKAMSLRKKIIKGADFADVAEKSSDDPSAKKNRGDLGYFSAFYMVYPFESAAYNTKVGEVSMPVRTDFGYHLIKVYDKRPSHGKVKVSHILITEPEAGDEVSKSAEEKAKEIYKQLKEGNSSFAELAKKYSEDHNSARAGGSLPAFSVGRMIPEFEEQAFALKEKGDISEPFKTDYGWHIIMLEGKEPVGSYESLKAEIGEKVRKDARSALTKDAILVKIKEDYGFKKNRSTVKPFYELIDSSYFNATWKMPEFGKKNKTMFSIGKKNYTQQDFAAYLAANMRSRNVPPVHYFVDDMFKNYVRKSLLDYKDSQLEKEYPEFAVLAKEYHDGILLFNLTDKKVWTRAVEDSIGLRSFYEREKENYMWGERAKASIYTVQNEKSAKKARKMLLKKDKKGYTVQDIKDKINDDSHLTLQVSEDVFSKGENALVDGFWKEGVSEIISKDGQYIIVEIPQLLPAGPKSLAEARGEVTSDYQQFLMDEWMEQLEKKYPVEVNEDALQELKTEYN